MNQTTEAYLLPCGRDVEEVWAQLQDSAPQDGHQAHCPHCSAARDGLQVLRELTGQLAGETAAPSPELTSRIMSAVRAEVHRHDVLALPSTEPGGVQISVQAAASVLRFAADSVPGVRARRCRVTTRTNDASEGVGAVDVELSIAVGYPFSGRDLELVRERVSAAAAVLIGVRLTRLDVLVADLYDL